jgi:hypothetical protein
MTVGERDKKMSDIGSMAAEAFAEKYDPATNERDIKFRPQEYLQHTIPYLTVRALHRLEETLERHEKALKSLEADSRWIKGLTFVLAALTIALVFYAWRLDTVFHSLESKASPTPSATPPAATFSPAASPVTH